MKCNQCESLYINGVFTHEHRCPNRDKEYDKKQEVWFKTYQCSICGYDVRENEICECHE